MTKPRNETLTQADLKQLLDYDPLTGQLTWLRRSLGMFKEGKDQKRACNSWNTQFVGKPALAIKRKDGYLHGLIHCKPYLAHRVIVCWMTGYWPPEEVDHVNGVRDDNRWANVNPVMRSENNRNKAMRSDNTSGVCGVSWDKDREKHSAQIHDSDGKPLCKLFDTFAEAVTQRQVWEKEFGYSERHGKEG